MFGPATYVNKEDRLHAEGLTHKELAKELLRIAGEQKCYRSMTIAILLEAMKRLDDTV